MPTVAQKTNRDLWLEALTQLSDEDQTILHVDAPDQREAAEAVLATAKAQETECKRKEWTFKFKGKEIHIRQVLGNVMKWVQKFEKIVDFGVSLDKSGHSAMPWAIIKFVLEVSTT